MLETLLLPFEFDFMRRAFFVALIIAVPTGFLSAFLVLRGWALMGDSISHAILPGIVIFYMLGLPLLPGAFLAGFGSALGTGFLAMNSRLRYDTVMGIVFSGMFAFGIVLYAWAKPEIHLTHILFGNILGLSHFDVIQTLLISGLVTLFLLITRQDLVLLGFDLAQAKASGLRVQALHYGLLVALTLTIISILNATGLILAIGLLITPGAIGYLLARRFSKMIIISVSVSVLAAFSGVYLSFHLNSDSAPTIILVLTLIFMLTFGWRSVVDRKRRKTG